MTFVFGRYDTDVVKLASVIEIDCILKLVDALIDLLRQHTSAYVSILSIRQYTSAYVSIRQHTSAYAAGSVNALI